MSNLKIKKNAIVIAFIFFFILNACDAAFQFGGQAVDLPPVKFFLFSCWVAFRNVIGYTLVALSLVFLLGRWSRWILVPMYAACVIVESSVIYTQYVFHANLAEIWQELVGNTTFSEIAGFLSMTVSVRSVLCMCFMLLIIVLFARLMFVAHYPQRSKRAAIVGIVLCLPFMAFNCVLMNWHFGVAQTKYSNFVVSSVLAFRRMKGVRDACRNERMPLRLVKADGKSPDVVIVLGESATCNDWHLYGYPRSTTPCMDKLHAGGKLVVYKDVVGTQPATVSALSLLLTDVSFDDLAKGHWTLAGVYREAGYRCVLISQQYSVSDTTSTMFGIFNGCEKRISVAHEFGKNVFDEKTIPLLERELSSCDGRPSLIFIHLSGMHYPVQNVIPEEEAFFSDSVEADVLNGYDEKARDRINRYDDAIRYEDKVLGGLIDVLAKSKRPAALFFISDHGESPRSEGWRDYRDEDVYCVPAVFWFSDEYRKRFSVKVRAFADVASRPIQSDEMTYGLLDLGCVQNEFTDNPKVNFLCGGFKGRTPRLIAKGRMVFKRDLCPK